MSVTSYAESELDRANFPPEEKAAILKILDIFFEHWDSGGAVSVMAPALFRLIACKPLSPLTGEDNEWNEVGTDQDESRLWQNKRCPTVFKTDAYAYETGIPGRGRVAISFPYMPKELFLADPMIEVETK